LVRERSVRVSQFSPRHPLIDIGLARITVDQELATLLKK